MWNESLPSRSWLLSEGLKGDSTSFRSKPTCSKGLSSANSLISLVPKAHPATYSNQIVLSLAWKCFSFYFHFLLKFRSPLFCVAEIFFLWWGVSFLLFSNRNGLVTNMWKMTNLHHLRNFLHTSFFLSIWICMRKRILIFDNTGTRRQVSILKIAGLILLLDQKRLDFPCGSPAWLTNLK